MIKIFKTLFKKKYDIFKDSHRIGTIVKIDRGWSVILWDQYPMKYEVFPDFNKKELIKWVEYNENGRKSSQKVL